MSDMLDMNTHRQYNTLISYMSKSFSWDNKQMIQNCTGRLPEQNDE